MKVILIGAGNTATALGKRMVAAGHTILQVCSRTREHAERLALITGAEAIAQLQHIRKDADMVMIAVTDDAIPEIVSGLRMERAIVVHTAGAVSRKLLENCSPHTGVIYPLQSITPATANNTDVPLLLDASDDETLKTLIAFAGSIALHVQQANDEERRKLHLAAVLVNNFTHHLYTLAADYCAAEALNFQLLLPLIRETAERLQAGSPASLQTGPARRSDKETIARHLQMLENYPKLQHIYQLLSNSIRDYYPEGIQKTGQP